MILILNDEFLNQYHIKDKSCYNNNYYRLPFSIKCDGSTYRILHITCDEFANEYNYALCFDIDSEEDVFIDERYIIPSCANNFYELNLENYSKTYDWY